MTGPSKTSGQIHSAKGSMKESVGRTIGAVGLQRSGAQEHAAGQAEIHGGKASGYAQGTAERAQGKKDQVVGALTGDQSQRAAGDYHVNKGDARQTYNRKY